MGIPDRSLSSKETVSLTPFGEACSRGDLTAIHEILEKVGYKDDEDVANEVILTTQSYIDDQNQLLSQELVCVCVVQNYNEIFQFAQLL